MKRKVIESNLIAMNAKILAVSETNNWYVKYYDSLKQLGFDVKLDSFGDSDWMNLTHKNHSALKISFTYNRNSKRVKFFSQNGTFVPDLGMSLSDLAIMLKKYLQGALTECLRDIENVTIPS